MAGVALAAVSYWGLHALATRPSPVVRTGQQIGDAIPTMLLQGLATPGQYLLPLVCLIGAALSAWRRHKRSALFDTATAGASADALQNML